MRPVLLLTAAAEKLFCFSSCWARAIRSVAAVCCAGAYFLAFTVSAVFTASSAAEMRSAAPPRSRSS